MSDYYPAGVTGREYAIAGPDREFTDERMSWCPNMECPLYNEEQDIEMDLTQYGNEEWGTAKCASCSTEWEYSGDV